MSWDDEVLANEGGPSLFEIWKRGGPVCFAAARVAANFEAEAPLRRVHEVALVEGAVMIHGKFGIVF